MLIGTRFNNWEQISKGAAGDEFFKNFGRFRFRGAFHFQRVARIQKQLGRRRVAGFETGLGGFCRLSRLRFERRNVNRRAAAFTRRKFRLRLRPFRFASRGTIDEAKKMALEIGATFVRRRLGRRGKGVGAASTISRRGRA